MDFHGKYCRLSHRVSGQVLVPNAFGGDPKNGDRVHTWPDPNNDEEGVSWLFIRASEKNPDQYYILHKRSGRALIPAGFGSNRDLRQVQHYEPKHDPDGSIWEVKPVDGYYRLTHVRQKLALIQSNMGATPDVDREAQTWTVGDGRRDQEGSQWAISVLGSTSEPEVPGPLLSELTEALPQLRGHQPRTRTEDTLVESKLLPYFLINDPKLKPEQQVKLSPFYRLNTYIYWAGDATIFLGNAGNTDTLKRTVTKSVTNGSEVSKTVSETFTTSTTITASTGIEIKAFSASIETSASEEWSQESSETRTQKMETSFTVSDELTAGPGRSVQLFYRVTKQQVVRSDGTVAREWEVKSNYTQTDAFPNAN